MRETRRLAGRERRPGERRRLLAEHRSVPGVRDDLDDHLISPG
jgi:hypothetical protein